MEIAVQAPVWLDDVGMAADDVDLRGRRIDDGGDEAGADVEGRGLIHGDIALIGR
jgi:hypothetical protein